jgi:RND family efflux transporter MFP subunit
MTNTTLAQIQSYLDSVALAVNEAVPAAIAPATLVQDKIDVSTARTEVGGAITAFVNAQTGLTNAQNTLTLANAGATPQDIEAQNAVVLQAQAALSGAQVALGHASLVTPFAGTVNNLTAKVGEVVTPGVPVVSVTNNEGLKIEGYVSQTEVANIKEGDNALITLDAYGTGTTFPATVTTVDSSETTVNGTSEYKVTLHFVNTDPRFKDGMTGNIHIITAEDDNVIAVPSNLVINNGNNYFVLVKEGNTDVEKQVTLGIVGDNMTEITSGLNVGDQIINF